MRLRTFRTWRHVSAGVVQCVVAHVLRCPRYLSWHPTKLVAYAHATNAGDVMHIDGLTKRRVVCHRGLRYEWDARMFEYQKVLLHTQPCGSTEVVVLRLHRVEVYALPVANEVSAPVWAWDVPFRAMSMCLCQDGRLLIQGYSLDDPDLTSRACTLNLITCKLEHSWHLPWPRVAMVRRAHDDRLALLMVARDAEAALLITLDTVTGAVAQHAPRFQMNLDPTWSVVQVGSNALAMVECDQVTVMRGADARVLDVTQVELAFECDNVHWLPNSREFVVQRNGYFCVTAVGS